MPMSPQLASDSVLCITVKSNGQAIADDIQLVSVHIHHAVARIPTARLLVLDGDMPAGDWPVADGAAFKPGAAITILAGYGDAGDTQRVFEGVVAKLGMHIGGDNQSRLEVECCGLAAKMAAVRNNAHYLDQTDSAVITQLIGHHGLGAAVDTTGHSHGGLTQYGSTDWDFIVARAAANGLLVIAADDKVRVQAPRVSDAPLLEVTWGIDMLEFHAEADVPGPWPQLQASHERIRGQMKFQGSASAQVGSMIKVVGLGARYKSDFFVAAVEHNMADGHWFTSVGFQTPPPERDAHATAATAAPTAAVHGAVPGAPGLQLGTVVQIHGDPTGEQRIQVTLPVLDGVNGTVWARVLQLHASNGFGALFMPEVGDEVVVDFFNHDPSQPVVLGSLYSSQHKPAHALAAANDIKSLVTRSQHRLEFDETHKVITVTTPAQNKVVLSDQAQSIVLHDQHGNQVALHRSGISLDSAKDLRLSAQGAITINAVGGVSITSSSDVAVSGLNVACTGQVAFSGKGSAAAELSATGQTIIKGAIVMIN